ncbi:hypothetical protein D3C81_1673800 [compost metagenome]
MCWARAMPLCPACCVATLTMKAGSGPVAMLTPAARWWYRATVVPRLCRANWSWMIIYLGLTRCHARISTRVLTICTASPRVVGNGRNCA